MGDRSGTSRLDPTRRPQVAVIGPGDADPEEEDAAFAVGAALANGGVVVVCGGLGGVMAAACRGARSVGGTTVGILPGPDASAANPWVDVVVPTGLGEGRNVLVVRAADAVVAVGGALGTLSELALALRAGVPVVGWRTWRLTTPAGEHLSFPTAADPTEAAVLALGFVGGT